MLEMPHSGSYGPLQDRISNLPSDLPSRCRPLNTKGLRDGANYVLCWVQQALRAHDNPLIDAAIALGNDLELPVLVYHGIRKDYPYASYRLHDFLTGGGRDLQQGCEARGLRAVNYVQTIDCEERGLVYRLAEDAAAVLTDDQPTFVARWQAESFAQGTGIAVIAVDAARLVPTQTLPKGLKTTPAFRKASGAKREAHAMADIGLEPLQPPYDGPVCFETTDLGAMCEDARTALIQQTGIDMSIRPSDRFTASRAAGLAFLETFTTSVLDRYKWTRSNPADPGAGSYLSPYLHFGLLGPRECRAAVQAADVHSAARWKFLDEMLTWREWFHYQAFYNPDFDSYDALPARCRDTLDAHADDPRETIYTLEDLMHGRTDDPTWNAAQRSWLATGYLNNNIRMYWGKKIIGWTNSPREAWAVACYINDRISLDGRDPATYGNLQWCFGHARQADKSRPVYGKVIPKTDKRLKARPGMTEWIEDWSEAELPDIAVPYRLSGYGFPA